jgi:AcrR family transcriptional regulator
MSAVAAPLPQTPVSMRDAILDAAEARFAGAGFDGVSVREIAADAGLKNQASLYHHFPGGKQAIYAAVLARGIDAITELVAASERAGSLRGDPAAASPYLDGVFDVLIARPHLARLMHRAALDDSPYARDAMPRMLQPLYALGVRILQDAGGPWQPSELPHLAAALYHLIFGYFADASLLQALLPEDPRSAPAVARQRLFIRKAVALLIGAAAPVAAPGTMLGAGKESHRA